MLQMTSTTLCNIFPFLHQIKETCVVTYYLTICAPQYGVNNIFTMGQPKIEENGPKRKKTDHIFILFRMTSILNVGTKQKAL